MSEFTLPSGRVLNLKERASYGDVSDAEDSLRDATGVNIYYHTLASILSGLTVAEIRELDVEDGQALEAEVKRRSGKRSVEADRPFTTLSGQSSTDVTPPETSTPEPSAA